MLEVGEENSVYWEECGNPNGTPAIVVHGGPGSGCTLWWRRLFSPEAYRIVLFDQRGCGRSKPHASLITTDMSTNKTANLIEDMELLRRHLGIDRKALLLGGSWAWILLRNANRLGNIRGVLVHGRYDLGTPIKNA